METITLKDDNIFLVSDQTGEINDGPAGYGLYYRDTRYLSRLELRLNSEKPQILSYTADYNIAATFRLSSNYMMQLEHDDSTIAASWTTAAHAIGVTRRRYVRGGLVEILEFVNYHPTALNLDLSLVVGADFTDIFEIRGFPSQTNKRVSRAEIFCQGQAVLFTSIPAETESGTTRRLGFTTNLKPDSYIESFSVKTTLDTKVPEVTLLYNLKLEPYKPVRLEFFLEPEPSVTDAEALTEKVDHWQPLIFAGDVGRAKKMFSDWEEACSRLSSNHYGLNKLYQTSVRDLRSLMQQNPHGLIVTAGIPWYFTLFGRDSLITALETLSLNPQIAIDTLRALAAYQATSFDDWRDSEPGKILHELRLGDMTLSGEMPHGPYYGSVDSTLLFILCFAETLKWTGDPAFFAELWPAVEKALHWAEEYGDLDRDGYIKFKRRSQRGILHQGWKDSDESMGGSIGPRPAGPLALVEVQGYYYAALESLARELRRYGNENQIQLAERLAERATRLKEQFNRDFWWEEAGFYAQALDGRGKQVRNITSNPGHCLWSGIIDEDKAARVVTRLMQPDMLCGWGIRTMSGDDRTYNPMSYHNGSIWPHDNALAIAGMRRYGFLAEAQEVSRQILEAAATFPDYRLPELYCGFARNEAGGQENAPAAYPVSCSPQAWAAGTGILLVQTLLGLEVDAGGKTVELAQILPEDITDLTLAGVKIASNRVDLNFKRNQQTGLIEAFLTQQSSNNTDELALKV